MGLRDVYQRMGFGAKRSSTHGRFLMDQLESRSMLSASTTIFTGSDPVTTTHIYTLAATKPTATLIKVYGKTSAAGAEVSIAAAVVSRSSGVPTGTITFMAGDTVLGTKTLGADGSVKISTTAIPSGTSVITAVYSGSSKFGASTSVGVSHVVTLAASTTKLSVTSDAGTTFGIPTTLLARVGSAANGDVPTGRVAFYDGGTLLGSKVVNSQGAARFTANFLYVGSHDLKAIYLGSSSYLGHRSTIKTVTVNAPTLSTASNGLQAASVVAGSGASALASDYVTVDYTLYVNGTELQSSIGSTAKFTLRPDGTVQGYQAIQGFSQGVVGAKVGETRVLVIPPELGYGSQAQSGIPANSTLVFVVQILAINSTPPAQ